MNDLERDLRQMFERREADLRVPRFAPDHAPVEVLGRAHRRQTAVVLVAIVAVLAVAVVSAAGAATLLRGSDRRVPADPNQLPVATCPPGSTPEEPGPVDQARPGVRSSVIMAFDRRAGRIVALAGNRSGSGTPSTWTFDVCTNTWQRMQPNTEPYHVPGSMAYDEDSDLIVAIDGIGSGVWAYALASDEWTPMPDADGSPPRIDAGPGEPVRLAYDPISGSILVQEVSTLAALWRYEVDANRWTEVAQDGPHDLLTPDHELIAFDRMLGRLVAFVGDNCLGCDSGDRTRTLDPRTGRWSDSDAATPDLNTGYVAAGEEIAYDESARLTVVFSDGFAAGYDAIADRWTRLYGRERCCQEGPLNRLHPQMVYDPVNERLVVYGGTARGIDPERGWAWLDDVWAFDVTTGTWTRLLAPSTESPAG